MNKVSTLESSVTVRLGTSIIHCRNECRILRYKRSINYNFIPRV